MGYFDGRISDARATKFRTTRGKHLELLDEELIFQCSVCSMLPGFPEDLGLEVNRLIIRFSWEANFGEHRPKYADHDAYADGLIAMCEGLKAVFEELERREIPGFSADPRSGVNHLYAEAARLRERLIHERRANA